MIRLLTLLTLAVLMLGSAACKHNQKSLNDFMRETARGVRS